jgi:L-seryl-tRNA(Ser) seleniumtransferase
LGAAQAGLIVGRRALIELLRKHPLYRALRADKLALVALEATLDAHRRATAFTEIPVLRMLAMTAAEINERAQAFMQRLQEGAAANHLRCELTQGASAIGGGAAPTTHPPTVLVALTHTRLNADALEEALRRSNTPVVARISDGKVLLDLRTVAGDEEATLLEMLAAIPA